MQITEHNKIVRDKIPEIIEKSGRRAVTKPQTPENILKGLETKLQEELNEYLADGSLEELADLVEVVRGILHHKNLTWSDLESIRLKKYNERGGFEKGVYLVRTEKE